MKKRTTSPEAGPQPRSYQTLANQITILRILLIPVIVIGLLKYQTTWVYVLLAFSMFTDFLDGLAARWKGERTRLGAFLDPMADKLFLTAIFITLTYLKLIDMWVFVVIFSRDLLIVLGWAIIYILTGSATIIPRALGKLATAMQMIAAASIILAMPGQLRSILLWLMISTTVASVIDYIMVAEKKLGGWA